MSGIKPDRAHAAALASVFIWALVPVGTRYFVTRIDPYMFNVIRYSASACAALPLFAQAKPWRWPTRDRWLLLACALLGIPGYNLPVALGARTVPAGELGVLIATEPVMIAALTLCLRRRAPSVEVVGGSVLALLGITLTSGVLNSTVGASWVSLLEVLGGAFSWSCYTVLAGALNRRHGTFGVTGAVVVMGTVGLLSVSLPMVDMGLLPDRTTLVILALMGISSSLLGFLLWNHAAAVIPAERLGLFLYLIPLVSLLGGTEFLGETLSVQVLFGAGLVLVGVWIASRRPALAAVIAE